MFAKFVYYIGMTAVAVALLPFAVLAATIYILRRTYLWAEGRVTSGRDADARDKADWRPY